MKIAIGCLIQWYEVEIIESYLSTLRKAIDLFRNESSSDCEVVVDLCLSTNTLLEKCIDDMLLIESVNKITSLADKYSFDMRYANHLHTISDYRREFNENYSSFCDVLVWGESDMLVPESMFFAIDSLHTSVAGTTPKYVATFASCKMWDSSWKPLEHPDFTDKEHSNNPNDWWGVRYTNTVDDMNRINERYETTDIESIKPFKFNGCGLVIASEIIKAGINIPKAVFFVHEDTAFLNMLTRFMPNITQYHFKHIYLPHNRKHPKKRMYIKGEEHIDRHDTGKLRKSHWWYELANRYSEENCYNLYQPNYRFKSWSDVFAHEPKNTI